MLAGDGIRCDFPVALMERAATTGFLAANRLLAQDGLAGHDLWTVPDPHPPSAAAPRPGDSSAAESVAAAGQSQPLSPSPIAAGTGSGPGLRSPMIRFSTSSAEIRQIGMPMPGLVPAPT